MIQLLLHSKVAKAELCLIGGYHSELLELTYYIETLIHALEQCSVIQCPTLGSRFIMKLFQIFVLLASAPPPAAPFSPFGFEAFKEETFENYGVTDKRTDY